MQVKMDVKSKNLNLGRSARLRQALGSLHFLKIGGRRAVGAQTVFLDVQKGECVAEAQVWDTTARVPPTGRTAITNRH
jgi:hypothetical protein